MTASASPPAYVPPVVLGSAYSYAVLAGSDVTSATLSAVNGDLGISPGSSVTGFPAGSVSGVTHIADGVAVAAKTDLGAAIVDAAGRAATVNLAGDLIGLTLGPAVYGCSSGLSMSGDAYLDAGGNASAVFIFQVASTLITSMDVVMHLRGGALACNVFWQVSDSTGGCVRRVLKLIGANCGLSYPPLLTPSSPLASPPS